MSKATTVRNLPMGFETQREQVHARGYLVRNLPMGFETYFARLFFPYL